MSSWNDIRDNVVAAGSTYDIFRRDAIRQLSEHTGRNTIIYYSGWLQKPQLAPALGIDDDDKNGFMATVHGLERNKGLDLILHTPGGETAATESLVDYLRTMFGTNIRAIVPQLAMSGGTMIACACKEIIMGKQSSLGPIDPQLGGFAAHGIIEEFKKAHEEIEKDKTKIPIWQPIIARYSPTLIGECQKVINWAEEMVKEWLETSMFENETNIDEKIKNIMTNLGDHALTKSHARHLPASRCKEIGLKIRLLEDEQTLQDLVLSIHHLCLLTITDTPAVKIIENQLSKSYLKTYNPPR